MPIDKIKSNLYTLRVNEGGAAAVEFAIVGAIFIFTILYILTAGMIMYMNQALDYATTATARDIMTGSAQANQTTSATFTNSLCNRLPSSFQCGNLIINLYKVTKAAYPAGYYSYVKPDLSGLINPPLTPGMGQFVLGNQGDYQYLQVIYPITFLPSGLASILSGGASFNNRPAYLAVSTAAFRNEQY